MRKSECHETKRCSCRFGCSSADGANGGGGGGGGGDAVVGSPGTAAVCGGGDEEEDGAAGGRVDEPNDEGCVCRVSGKDVHEGATDGENVVVLMCSSSERPAVAVAGRPPPPLTADSDACGRPPFSSPAPALFQTLSPATEPKASEDDERPPRACGNGGCEGCASTSDAGPRA